MADVLGSGAALGRGVAFGSGSFTYAWAAKANLPAARMNGMMAVVNGYIYYLGGTDTNGSTDVANVYKYDPSIDTWTTVTSLSAGREQAAVGVYNDKIYLLSGLHSGSPYLNVVEYDPATGVTTQKNNSVPYPYNAPYIWGQIGTKIWWESYGYGSGDFHSYDMATNTYWNSTVENGAVLGNWAAGAVSPDGKFRMFGGDGDDTGHHVYDTVGDTFTSSTAVPSPGYNYGQQVLYKGGLFYVIAGRQGNSSDTGITRAFDPLTLTWSLKATLPLVRAFGTAVLLGNVIYYAGGNQSGSAPVNTFYAMRVPEIDGGVVSAVGQGTAQSAATSEGAAMGVGTAHGDGEVHFSAKRMYSGGAIPITGAHLIEYLDELHDH